MYIILFIYIYIHIYIYIFILFHLNSHAKRLALFLEIGCIQKLDIAQAYGRPSALGSTLGVRVAQSTVLASRGGRGDFLGRQEEVWPDVMETWNLGPFLLLSSLGNPKFTLWRSVRCFHRKPIAISLPSGSGVCKPGGQGVGGSRLQNAGGGSFACRLRHATYSIRLASSRCASPKSGARF